MLKLMGKKIFTIFAQKFCLSESVMGSASIPATLLLLVNEFIDWFGLWFNIPVNSYSNVGAVSSNLFSWASLDSVINQYSVHILLLELFEAWLHM